MHTTALRSDEFELRIDDRPATIQELFPGFDEHDRLGIVLGADHAGAGASTLILAAVTGFYDRLRASGGEFLAYPDYFAFHVARPRGSLRKLDVFPEHKEVVVPADAEQILRAINDRAVTRLLVGDGTAAQPELAPATRAGAERRIRSAVAYAPSGRVADADVVIRGSTRTESYVEAMLAGSVAGSPGDRALRQRAGIHDQAGRPIESFRRVALDSALRLLLARAG